MSTPGRVETEFPLFPLGLVTVPAEAVPLHVFEERYKTMIGLCVAEDRPFGIVWLAEDELHSVGCACRVEEVLEQLPDGRMNILARGVEPIEVIERQSHLPYPSGVVAVLTDTPETPDLALAAEARSAYRELVERATGRELEAGELAAMSAYAMVATVEFGLEAKQGLLELRSENRRLNLALRLFRAAIKRLDFIDLAQTRARSNGKVRFG